MPPLNQHLANSPQSHCDKFHSQEAPARRNDAVLEATPSHAMGSSWRCFRPCDVGAGALSSGDELFREVPCSMWRGNGESWGFQGRTHRPAQDTERQLGLAFWAGDRGDPREEILRPQDSEQSGDGFWCFPLTPPSQLLHLRSSHAGDQIQKPARKTYAQTV